MDADTHGGAVVPLSYAYARSLLEAFIEASAIRLAEAKNLLGQGANGLSFYNPPTPHFRLATAASEGGYAPFDPLESKCPTT